MKRTVLVYGLLSGAVSGILMLIMTFVIRKNNSCDNMAIYGYAGMVLSSVFVFLGVKSYRDTVIPGGAISFGQALGVGLLISLVSAICYVISWQIIYTTLMPDFLEVFSRSTLEHLKANGASEEMLQKQTAELMHFKEMYKNPFTRAALTFIEPLPVGVVVPLVSAAVLRKRPG